MAAPNAAIAASGRRSSALILLISPSALPMAFTILVIDDEPEGLETATESLTSRGHRVLAP
jgi:hypothetical protein